MALWDFLKRKKEIEKAKTGEKDKKSPLADGEKILDAKKEVKSKAAKTAREVKGFSYDIVKEPHISEKGTNLGQENKYVFKIQNNTNKPEIKKAVEGIYGVDVLSVNVIKIPRKKRRMGKTEGFKKGYVKAVVTIKEGQKIEIL